MSELSKADLYRIRFRLQLLGTVSAGCLFLLGPAARSDEFDHSSDRPTVWIELGGQLSRSLDQNSSFVPPFALALQSDGFASPAASQKLSRYSYGGEFKANFQPSVSDWVFAAGVRYGRSSASKRTHEQTAPAPIHNIVSVPAFSIYRTAPETIGAARYSDTKAVGRNSFAIVDFNVGRDVGLGLLGMGGHAQFGVGIRAAQFEEKSDIFINGDPTFRVVPHHMTIVRFFRGQQTPFYISSPRQAWDLYAATSNSERSFRGIGPAISWNASVPILGQQENGELSFDISINGSILFGRQKASVQSQTYHRSRSEFLGTGQLPTVYHHSKTRVTDRSIISPNVGGLMGLSVRYDKARISLGYRADLFVSAMDRGIDRREARNKALLEPFIALSLGF